MSPRRFAVFILAILIPALIWGATLMGKDDLLFRTRSFMGQAKKDRPGKFEGFAQLCRPPSEPPEEATEMLQRLWTGFRMTTPDKTTYGSKAPIRLSDGKEHEHRQVVVDGHGPAGQQVTMNVEWVRFMGNWYIQGFSGSAAETQPRRVEGNPYGLPPNTTIVN
jgi:hypothetical protein